LLAAVGTIPVLYLVGRRLGSRRTALIACTFLSFAWLTARYGQEVRAYAVVLLLVTVSWGALIESVRRGPDRAGRWWRLYAIVTTLAVLTHGLVILQFGAQLVVLMVAPQVQAWRRKAVPVFISCCVAMLAMIIPGGGDTPTWIKPLSLSQVHELYTEFTGRNAVVQLVLGMMLVVGVATAVRHWMPRRTTFAGWQSAAIVVWALGAPLGLIAVSPLHPVMVPRYVIGSAPAVALLLAMAVDALPKRVLRAAAVIVVVVALIPGQVSWHHYQEDWTGAAHEISAEAHPGDGLFLPNPFVRPQLDYVWLNGHDAPKGLKPVTPFDAIASLPRFYTISDLTEDQLEQQIVKTKLDRLWVVDQDANGSVDLLPHYLAHQDFRARFRVASTTNYQGAITVSLLVRR
jgi:mannosyltransferase